MPVPAIAFAWWLVAFPMKTLPSVAVAAGTASATESPPSADATADADEDDEWAGQRVPLRGPIPLDVVRTAQTFLDLPMGAERLVRLHDQRYVFVLEWHYHPQGFVGAPTGWHKGVTVYVMQ